MDSAKMIELKSEKIKAIILPERGALISSLFLNEREVLFLPDEFDPTLSSWPDGGLPLLFPFSGRVFNETIPGEYFVADQKFKMPLHGFGFGAKWGVENQSENSLDLVLGSENDLFNFFPWDFKCSYNILLTSSELTLTLKVTNIKCSGEGLSEELPMPVYPGVHPYFKVNDEFEVKPNELNLKYDVTPAGAVGKSRDIGDDMILNFESDWLKNGILSHEKYSSCMVKAPGGSFEVLSPDSKYTVLWSNDQEKFQCVEPWVGLPDAANFAAIGKESQGKHPFSCYLLNKGQTKSFEFKIKI